MGQTPRRPGKTKNPPSPSKDRAFEKWLLDKPLEWSIAIAVRAALRAVPLIHSANNLSSLALQMFRGSALALFCAKYPTRSIDEISAIAAERSVDYASQDENNQPQEAAYAVSDSIAVAAWAARRAITDADYRGVVAQRAARSVLFAASAASSVADTVVAARVIETAFFASARHDAQQLSNGTLTPERLAATALWLTSAPSVVNKAWQTLSLKLSAVGGHWWLWIDWYQKIVSGSATSESRDAAFTDALNELPWEEDAQAVNAEIARRLGALASDPSPVEGIPSPIAINRRVDGRIGADAGALGAPTLPPSLTSENHAHALSACRSRAEQLSKTASLPNFQGRREYGEALAAYLDWLPTEAGTGNILLADGEARVLNKLFAADEAIIAAGFASRLSVLLEDHIALRAFYPEVERHYHSVRTGRIATPLARDAVESIRAAIHANTPTVFDESVAPAMDETAKPVPEVKPPAAEDAPPLEPGQPKPPKDPIADVDPAKSRSFTFASAANRIWEILQKGRDLPQVIDGWQKAYDQFKPHIGSIIEWLKNFRPRGGDGTPPMPPTISV